LSVFFSVQWTGLLNTTGENFFDCVPTNGKLEGGIEPVYANEDVAGAVASSALDTWAREEVHDEIDPEEDGSWTLMKKSCTQSMGTKWPWMRMKSLVLVQHQELAKLNSGYAIHHWQLIMLLLVPLNQPCR
jgi:hypothetical protein